MTKKTVVTRKVTIKNESGLHARPASLIAKIARKATGTVKIGTSSKTVNAASMIDILTLACFKNTEVIISTEKKDIKILEEIESLIEADFGE